MSSVLFAAAGLVDDFLLLCGFVLISATMHYGFFAEELCRPMYDSVSGKPTVWIKARDRPDTLFLNWIPCLAPFERLFPNLLGWLPYSTIWFIFVFQFLSNATDEETGRSAPAFVWAILGSQLVLFSCFGFVSIVNLSWYTGPSFFYWSEFTYVLLSFIAKGALGAILILSVLIFSSFEEAAAS